MLVSCTFCDWSGDVPKLIGRAHVRYKCHGCRRPITSVSVFGWADWIEMHADEMERHRRAGRIGTRRQANRESDRDISAVGTGAELAACVILAPWKLPAWIRCASGMNSNRGCDFPGDWFADGRAVEVKFTPRPGHLLVRPPSNTPGPMLPRYIDDSIYVLMNGAPYTYDAVGWAGRSDLLQRGCLNPIPIRGRQRECWGIHADELNPMQSLFRILGTKRKKRRD